MIQPGSLSGLRDKSATSTIFEQLESFRWQVKDEMGLRISMGVVTIKLVAKKASDFDKA